MSSTIIVSFVMMNKTYSPLFYFLSCRWTHSEHKDETFSILTSTDTEFNIMFNLCFVVSNGVPSVLKCVDADNNFILRPTGHGQNTKVSREVIRSHYTLTAFIQTCHVSC